MNPLRQYISRNRRKQHFFTLLYMTPLVLKSLNGHYKVEAGTCVHIFHCTYMTHIKYNEKYGLPDSTHHTYIGDDFIRPELRFTLYDPPGLQVNN